MNRIPDYINLTYQEKWEEKDIFDMGDKWIGTSYLTKEKYIAKILEDKEETIVIGYFMRVIEKCLSDNTKESVVTDLFSTDNDNYNIKKIIDYKLLSEVF